AGKTTLLNLISGDLRPRAGRVTVTGRLTVLRQATQAAPGETVGYACSWTAQRPSLVATLSAGYADGLPRTLSNRVQLWDGDTPVPLIGRVSMDLITADITDLPHVPRHLDILGPHQSVDQLADIAGTIGYEILTSLGPRYSRRYLEQRDGVVA
ncbi:MAG: alanine racemase, partial [Pseudomonadota bacterium]